MTRFRFVAMALVVALAVALGGAAATSANDSSRSIRALDTLNVAEVTAVPNFVVLYVAQAEGIFQKYGLNVNILENAGANTLNLLVSGQADLTWYATSNALLLAAQGQPTTVIMNGSRDTGSAILGAPSITTLDQLSALGGNCTIGTLTVGTQTYGYAVQYVASSKLKLQQCTLRQVGTAATLYALLQSGQVQAAVMPLSSAVIGAQTFGEHLLVSPNKTGYRKEFGFPNFMNSSWFGLTSTVQAKQASIINFLKAINEANKLVVPKNLTRLATDLEKFSVFQSTPLATLRQSLTYVVNFLGNGITFAAADQIKAHPNALTSNPGYIPASVWQTSVQQYAKWGLTTFDPNASYSAYGQRVNMSYLAAAIGCHHPCR